MLRHLRGASGFFYLILSPDAPVLKRWYKNKSWVLVDPSPVFWENVESMNRLSEVRLTQDLEALYDEICIFR